MKLYIYTLYINDITIRTILGVIAKTQGATASPGRYRKPETEMQANWVETGHLHEQQVDL